VKIVEKMDMIPQYTFAGDYTVEAIEKASQEVMKFDAGMCPTIRASTIRLILVLQTIGS
jgi:hypothetical protein